MPAAFNRLLLTWFGSLTGDGLRFAALPLLAFAVVPSPGAVSTVAAATALPWLLVALPAGALVDRLDPATVIAWANAGRALTTGLLAAAIVSHRADIALLSFVGFVLTTAETFADSAAQSLLVRLVPPDKLDKANARFVSCENLGLDLLGPLAAGALFTAARWLPFAVAAAVFAGTTIWVIALRGHRVMPDDRVSDSGVAGGGGGAGRVPDGVVSDRELVDDLFPGGAVPGGAVPGGGGSDGGVRRGGVPGTSGATPGAHISSVGGAVRTILSSADLRTLVVTVAVMAAAIAAAEGVLVVYSTAFLHLSVALYPTLLACYSVGAVVAATALSRRVPLLRTGTMMLAAVTVIGTMLLVLGLFPSTAVAWSAFLLMGGAGGVWNVLSATRRQRRTPPSMVARVSSTFRAIAWGALPLGTALGGLVGEKWSVPAVFVLAGLAILAIGAVMGRRLRHADFDAGGAVVHPDREATSNLPRAPGSA